jgi:hypothetical protein
MDQREFQTFIRDKYKDQLSKLAEKTSTDGSIETEIRLGYFNHSGKFESTIRAHQYRRLLAAMSLATRNSSNGLAPGSIKILRKDESRTIDEIYDIRDAENVSARSSRSKLVKTLYGGSKDNFRWMVKDNIMQVDIMEFGVRISKASEKDLNNDVIVNTLPVITREKKRTTYIYAIGEKLMKLDLTTVTQIDGNSSKSRNSYEAEIEFITSLENHSAPNLSFPELCGAMYFHLTLLQASSQILEQSEQISAIKSFNSFMNGREYNNPEDIKLGNLAKLQDYAVTVKVDGMRLILFADLSKQPKVYAVDRDEISQIGLVTTTYSSKPKLETSDKTSKQSEKSSAKTSKTGNIGQNIQTLIADCEFYHLSASKKILFVFDIMFLNGLDLRNKPFTYRIKTLREALADMKFKSPNELNSDAAQKADDPDSEIIQSVIPWEIKIIIKNHFPLAKSLEPIDICYKSLNNYVIEGDLIKTDGLIFTKLSGTYHDKIMKWKPLETLSLDLEIRDVRQDKGTYYFNIFAGDDKQRGLAPFVGNEAFHISNKIRITNTPFELSNNMIVEFRFGNRALGEQILVPIRVRYDKQFPNAMGTAISVWENMINPITIETLQKRGDYVDILLYKTEKCFLDSMLRAFEGKTLLAIGYSDEFEIWLKYRMRVTLIYNNEKDSEKVSALIAQTGFQVKTYNIIDPARLAGIFGNETFDIVTCTRLNKFLSAYLGEVVMKYTKVKFVGCYRDAEIKGSGTRFGSKFNSLKDIIAAQNLRVDFHFNVNVSDGSLYSLVADEVKYFSFSRRIPHSLRAITQDKMRKLPYHIVPNLVRIGVIGDGSCFIHAILRGFSKLYNNVAIKDKYKITTAVRTELTNSVTKEKFDQLSNGTLSTLIRYEQFLNHIKKEYLGDWAFEYVSNFFGLDFYIFSDVSRGIISRTNGGFTRCLILLNINNTHWELIGQRRGLSVKTSFRQDDDLIQTLNRELASKQSGSYYPSPETYYKAFILASNLMNSFQSTKQVPELVLSSFFMLRDNKIKNESNTRHELSELGFADLESRRIVKVLNEIYDEQSDNVNRVPSKEADVKFKDNSITYKKFTYNFSQERLHYLLSKTDDIRRLAGLAMKYSSLIQLDNLTSILRTEYEEIIHETFSNNATNYVDGVIEGFASPLDSQIVIIASEMAQKGNKLVESKEFRFCSLYQQLEGIFGSLGSFFDNNFSNKLVLVNPPNIEEIILKTISHILANLEGKNNIFILYISATKGFSNYPDLTSSGKVKKIITLPKTNYKIHDPVNNRNITPITDMLKIIISN